MQKEIWRPIIGYEGLYEVSNMGRFRKLGNNGDIRYLKATKNNFGYYTIGLWKDKKVRQFRISRLIAETFIPNPENKPYVDHIDTNKANNNVCNLRWVTPAENSNNNISREHMVNSWKCEERRKKQREINFGGRHPRAKTVYQLAEDGTVIKVFSTASEAARELGCKSQNIVKCCTGERLRAGGYRWRH